MRVSELVLNRVSRLMRDRLGHMLIHIGWWGLWGLLGFVAFAKRGHDVHQSALVSVVALTCLLMVIIFAAVLIRTVASEPISAIVSLKLSSISEWVRSHGQELFFYGLLIALLIAYSTECFGQVRIPGSDESAKLKAAGTLLMLMDTALFVWLARIFAGLCVLSAGWLIKEQKFGPAVVCVLGALVIGTSPMWVQNIFEIGGGGGVFK